MIVLVSHYNYLLLECIVVDMTLCFTKPALTTLGNTLGGWRRVWRDSVKGTNSH